SSRRRNCGGWSRISRRRARKKRMRRGCSNRARAGRAVLRYDRRGTDRLSRFAGERNFFKKPVDAHTRPAILNTPLNKRETERSERRGQKIRKKLENFSLTAFGMPLCLIPHQHGDSANAEWFFRLIGDFKLNSILSRH